MQALRVKTHLDCMCAGGDVHCTQNIIGACDVCRLAVDGCLPSRLVIDLGEYYHPVFGRGGLINEVVGRIADKFDGTCRRPPLSEPP